MDPGVFDGSWNIQMELGTSKWSLERPNETWDGQMELWTCKWNLGCINGFWDVQMELSTLNGAWDV